MASLLNGTKGKQTMITGSKNKCIFCTCLKSTVARGGGEINKKKPPGQLHTEK